ncbi:hypothetical protein IAT38_002089 [Cryptococcus sp. DSM 104549]
MSLEPPHLPSPAPTPSSGPAPFPAQPAGFNPPTDQAALRKALDEQLLKLSQDLYELEICAGDVQAGRENAAAQYLKRVSEGFIQLSQMSSQMTDSVPRQVIDHVDRYKNPHMYTRQVITRGTGENQYALGRVLGLENFRRQLHGAVAENFPEIPLPDRQHKPVQSAPESGSQEAGEGGDFGQGASQPGAEQHMPNGHGV